MVKFYIKLLFVGLITLVSVQTYAGNSDRAGEAGAYELLISSFARTNGMMGINSASVRSIDALGTNVAGLAYNRKMTVYANYLNWLNGTGTTKINTGLAYELSPGNNIALAIDYMTFGKIDRTTTEFPAGIGQFSPNMMNIGLSYARVFGEGVRAGITGKLITEQISNVSASGFSIDAGMQYTTGEKKDFHFGVFIRNLGFPMTMSGDGLAIYGTNPNGTNTLFSQRAAKFELPTQFSIGLTKDLFIGKVKDSMKYCKPFHRLSISTNYIYNAFIQDNFGLGFEYAFKESLALRVGYLYEKDAINKDVTTRAHMGVAAGVSYDFKMGKDKNNPSVLELSYNYRPTWIFDGTHNLGITYYLSKSAYCDPPLVRKKKEVVKEVKVPAKDVKPKIIYKTKYDTIFKKAPAEIKTVVQYKQVNALLKDLTGNIEFVTNTAILTPRGEGALSVIGELMRKYPKNMYNIAGHTDSDGASTKNMRLSRLRAKTVARYLYEYKQIPESSMKVEWFGEEKPIAPNTSKAGKQRNRRVEITVLEDK